MAPKVKFAKPPVPEAETPVAVEEAPVTEDTKAPELEVAMPDKESIAEMSLEELNEVDRKLLTEDELNLLVRRIAKLSPTVPKMPPLPLRQDGPTLEEWIERGNHPAKYPPEGYASRIKPALTNASKEATRIKDSREALKQPLGPNQKFFEAPDGTIIVGEAGQERVWFQRLNDGKGGYIHPLR